LLTNVSLFLVYSVITCRYMKLSVKNPERKSATNMLTKLLSNILASEINYDGGNGKIAFKSLKLYNLFQGNYLH